MDDHISVFIVPRTLRNILILAAIAVIGLGITHFMVTPVWFHIVETIVEFCYAFVVGPFLGLRIVATLLWIPLRNTRAVGSFLTEVAMPGLDNMVLYTVGLVGVGLTGFVVLGGTLRLLYLL